MAVRIPGSERPLLTLPGLQQPEDVSRDGRLLAYLNQIETSAFNIRLLPLDGEREPVRWLPTPFNQSSPRFSPDGLWIAYESDESGSREVYVALTKGAGEKRRISREGGRQPRWSQDGRELYYVSSRGTLAAVPVTPGPKWTAGAPTSLFRIDAEIENYDVTPDGSRFLICTPVEKSPESPLRVILNWPALLKADR
jgi:Tol biopolymer transport system component